MTTDDTIPTGSRVQKWADAAMYTAEPSRASDGPRVYLLSMTPDPLGVIAAACKMYKGEVVRSLADVTHAERREFFEQVQKTHLQAPFEFVDFHFMIEGVTRSFTHQMVRQRTAVYAQESLRFAVKEDAADAVALPPSIYHTRGDWACDDQVGLHLDDDEKMRREWDLAVQAADTAYNRLVNMGMPAEDARGLLPHNITTRLHYKTNLRNLLEHAGNRLCTQAQFEWRQVWVRIVEAIKNYRPQTAQVESMRRVNNLEAEVETTLGWLGESDAWQFELLSTIFRPICYLTGKCEFRANFDRACSIRDRVDGFHKHGVPSTDWDKPFFNATDAGVKPIFPAEWLLDPAAARVPQ